MPTDSAQSSFFSRFVRKFAQWMRDHYHERNASKFTTCPDNEAVWSAAIDAAHKPANESVPDDTALRSARDEGIVRCFAKKK
jgi:hypothetical protein